MPHSTIEPQSTAALQPANFSPSQISAVRHCTNTTEFAILKIFIDYRVFDAIPEEGDIEISELAEKIGGQQSLMERFSNFLVMTGVLSSPAPGRIAHTIVSRGYRGDDAPALTVVHLFNYLLRTVAYWPEYFEKNGLREPKTADVNPLGLATGYPDRNLYGILETEPKKAELFNLMLSRIATLVSLKGIYDFGWVKSFVSSNQERPLIVDVGGGKGQGLKAIFGDNPSIPPSRCVIVDRPDVIEENKRDIDEELRSVQLVEGNMFEEQPVKGALIYHISRVLNDWTDDNVIQVLKLLRAACASDSRILIVEELLLPNPSLMNLAQDVFFLNWGGKRRNGRMFEELARQAGLRVKGIFTGEGSDCGVIELIPM